MFVVACLQWKQRLQVYERVGTAGCRGCEQILSISVTEVLLNFQCSGLMFTGTFDVRAQEAADVISDESIPLHSIKQNRVVNVTCIEVWLRSYPALMRL